MYRVSKNIVFWGSFMYRYTQYTIYDVSVYRVPNSIHKIWQFIARVPFNLLRTIKNYQPGLLANLEIVRPGPAGIRPRPVDISRIHCDCKLFKCMLLYYQIVYYFTFKF